MNLGIKDKKALITTASKGPGRACAISLAREGADRYSVLKMALKDKYSQEFGTLAFFLSYSRLFVSYRRSQFFYLMSALLNMV